MQVTLDAFALKPFTKALTCLSRYGDELIIYATPESLSLSATNSSKSAYCRFKYEKQFFSKYRLHISMPTKDPLADDEDMVSVTGQLLTKSLLSILKHRTIEKTVERCDMSVVEGSRRTSEDQGQDEEDGLESRLIVRLHCKHGVIKTHRLVLLTPTSLMAPGVPDVDNESNLTIGPKSVKDMIEHFPIAKGPRYDPQLVWTFGHSDVELRSLESSIDTKGKAQLATELTISVEEFDVYSIYAIPTTIAFHLREFNATIAYADSMSSALDLRFTDPTAPLFIDVEGDHTEALFVISTSHIHGVASGVQSQHYQTDSSSRKRGREETPAETRSKKSMNAVQRVQNPGPLGPRAAKPNEHQSPSPLIRDSAHPSQREPTHRPPSFIPQNTQPLQVLAKEPLFLPSSSQLSSVDEAVLRSTGLGIENMDVDELTHMWEGDGEEVAFDFASQDPHHHGFSEQPGNTETEDPDSLEIAEEPPEIPPTQVLSEPKMFHALFED